MEHFATKLARLAAPRSLIFGSAAAVLALDPVIWLINTWTDPSYASQGWIVFALCLGLFAWSVSSPKGTSRPVDVKTPLVLLAGTAVIRLVGQILAINVIGALALVVDVYAIGRLCALDRRRRPLSPLWLAGAFAFSLPLERIVQRTIGYPLQHLSADGACGVLGGLYDGVVCQGTHITLLGQDVLVDLPCSGARGLLQLLLFAVLALAVSRPAWPGAVAGLGLALVVGWTANVLRIVLLAIGLADPTKLGGLDVMSSPWHDLIGLLALALGCVPLILWARRTYRRPKFLDPALDKVRWSVPDCVKYDAWWLERTPRRRPTLRLMMPAIGLLIVALVVVNLPRTPVDVAPADLSLTVPAYLYGAPARPVPLSEIEHAYFTKYGGAAAKAIYGNNALLLVRTSSPLRHLHAPDECLRGLGFDVSYVGVSRRVTPTAIYKAVAPDGTAYRVSVSFISDRGHVVPNVAEAVWLWLSTPGSVWTAVQRITPWDAPPSHHFFFDFSVATALDVTSGHHFIPATFNGGTRHD